MRRPSQSAFLAVVVLLAALPHLLADSTPPVQVQLDVTVLTCSAEVLAGCKLGQEGRAPARFGCLGASDRKALLEKVRGDKRTKLVAEPKVVCMSGRPASFMSGGQVPVSTAGGKEKSVEFRDIGLEVGFLPIVQPGGRVYLEVSPRIRSVHLLHGAATTPEAAPGFDEVSVRTAADLKPNQSFAIVFDGSPFGHGIERQQTLVLVTPTILGASASTPAESQSGRLKKIAAMLVDEYRAACDANNNELATKLSRHALELDPMCFHQPHASCPPPAVCPVPGVLAVPAGYVTPTVPPAKPAEPAPECTEQPGETEVLKALPKAARESIEIVCEKMIDKIDAPRFYPLIGIAQMHHCHWKCTVYSADAKTHQRRCEVIYIDTDFLHSSTGDPVAVPENKPTGTKVGRWWDTYRPRLINAYSSDPNERMKQLINQSEDLRQVRDEWQRIWFQDQPAHVTPVRVHGGIQ